MSHPILSEVAAHELCERELNTLLERGLGATHCALESGAPGPFALGRGDARWMITLEGTRFYRFGSGENAVEVRHEAGDVLFIGPNVRVEVEPRASYRVCVLALMPHFVRWALAQWDEAHDAKQPEGEALARATRLGLFYGARGADELLDALARFLATPDLTERERRRAFELGLERALHHLCNPPGNGQTAHLLRAAHHFISENCHLPMGRDDVARALSVSPGHVSRLFAGGGDESFGAFLLHARLERAVALLDDATLNIAQVAARCGFASPGHFSQVFRALSNNARRLARS